MTDETEDREHENDFEAAVAALEASAPAPLMRRVIDRRETIERLRARRVPWEQIAELLKSVGIEITAGGLRNYSSRIRIVIKELEAAGENAPDGDRIYAACRARARPATAASHRRAWTSPAIRGPDIRPGRPGRSAAKRTNLTRDPDEGL